MRTAFASTHRNRPWQAQFQKQLELRLILIPALGESPQGNAVLCALCVSVVKAVAVSILENAWLVTLDAYPTDPFNPRGSV
jgi:beta-lactamase regulating signal transducer with metallopeptidase domain